VIEENKQNVSYDYSWKENFVMNELEQEEEVLMKVILVQVEMEQMVPRMELNQGRQHLNSNASCVSVMRRL
jgi:hypothetical protein